MTFLATFLTIPNLEVAGISHLALQPLALMVFALGFAFISGAKAWVRRLFVAAYFTEGLLFYFLKTFDRTGLRPEQLSFGFAINARIKKDQQLLFLFDQAPEVAGFLRVLVLLSIAALFVYVWREFGSSPMNRSEGGPLGSDPSHRLPPA